ncbi:anti-sigma factor [Neolewinella agarilytica]|uniref:Uncharacterized protein n=1 Tax=Neolewinella agarilytica TaxID=478744 RepID=A0A1H9HA64_9BACT|nr:hypothetical protein [Neolewinella agarilytica]SEQ59128.1 hypothetical protein SAMN05444359_11275 [Neolewinella agarilytica]
MLNDKDIALLEAYTYGEISPEAEAELRGRLEEDADFAAAVRRWELVEREGFVIEPSVATRAAVADALNREKTGTEERSSGIPWWWYILGALTVGLLAYGGWSLLHQPSTAPATAPENAPTEVQADGPYADLVREYFRHLPSENFHLGSEETLEERALAAYEARDYATALPLLLETVEMGGDSLNLLYAGVAALGLGDGEAAVMYAEAVLNGLRRTEYFDDANYIKVLGLIQADELEVAKVIIQSQASNSKYSYIELNSKIDN